MKAQLSAVWDWPPRTEEFFSSILNMHGLSWSSRYYELSQARLVDCEGHSPTMERKILARRGLQPANIGTLTREWRRDPWQYSFFENEDQDRRKLPTRICGLFIQPYFKYRSKCLFDYNSLQKLKRSPRLRKIQERADLRWLTSLAKCFIVTARKWCYEKPKHSIWLWSGILKRIKAPKIWLVGLQ